MLTLTACLGISVTIPQRPFHECCRLDRVMTCTVCWVPIGECPDGGLQRCHLSHRFKDWQASRSCEYRDIHTQSLSQTSSVTNMHGCMKVCMSVHVPFVTPPVTLRAAACTNIHDYRFVCVRMSMCVCVCVCVYACTDTMHFFSVDVTCIHCHHHSCLRASAQIVWADMLKHTFDLSLAGTWAIWRPCCTRAAQPHLSSLLRQRWPAW